MSSLIIEVCKIENVEKHPNADRLAIATVKGWKCIVGLNDFDVGDLTIFCPPDSIIPTDIIDKLNLEYLRKGGRVRTTKLRGFISQGLCLPMSLLPKGRWEGKNVAKILRITKYEPSEPYYQQFRGGQPTKKKRNPLFDKYTDIENINNFNTVFQNNDLVVITEKIHGTNFRAGKLKRYRNNLWGKIMSFFFGKYEFVYGSHNVQLCAFNRHKNFYGEDIYGKIAKKYNLAEIIPNDYILYGEIYGKGIQKLTYGMEDIDVVFFDVKYKGKYLNQNRFLLFCAERNLPVVPILYQGIYLSGQLERWNEGASELSKSLQIREGCVVKSLIEENHPRIGRKILKNINPEYLAKKDRTDYH